MIKIILCKQSTNYSCGPTSLKMALAHLGISKSEKSLIKLIGAKAGYGCDPEDIVRATKTIGLKARYRKNSSINEIKRYLDNNHSLIVDWFSPSALGHYSVVAAINNSHIILADPEIGKLRKLKINDFLYRWFELDDYPPKDPKNFVLRELIIIDKNF